MKTCKNLLLVLLLFAFCQCSIMEEAGVRIESPYSDGNNFIEGAYTSFYNRDLKISEDIYAIYTPNSKSYTLPLNQFKIDNKIIGKHLCAELEQDNFVFHLQGKFSDISTRFYFIPYKQLASITIKGSKYKNRIYNLYSFPTEHGQIIQLFCISQKKKGNHKDYMNYLKECDAIIQKLCYGDYYKISYPSDSKILIDLQESKFSTKKLKMEMLQDTTLINTNNHKIISIPSNREQLTVSFQLSDIIENMITKGETIVCEIYDKQKIASNPLVARPILRQELKESTFTLDVNIFYNDYIIIVKDCSGNLMEAICLNVW